MFYVSRLDLKVPAYAVITEVAENNLFNEQLLQCLLVHQSLVWVGIRK